MLTLDVFNALEGPFSASEMTAAIDKIGYKPTFLSSLPGLYIPTPVRTLEVWIEARANAPALIQTSPRGTPPKQKGGIKRNARSFSTDRIALSSRITAAQLQSIRPFGKVDELTSLAIEIAERQAKLRDDFELTKEYHLLGMVQGKFVDADGTVIRDWATEFTQTIPTEIDFDLDAATPAEGVVRKKCNAIKRSIVKGLQGLGGAGVTVHALCGDDFWDNFVNHSEIIKTYLNYAAAADLRGGFGGAYQSFSYGDIVWHNYRGTDDGSTVAVAADKAKFFPVGAGIFQMAYSPAETFDFVNAPGRELYSWTVPDKDRYAWADVEMYSYPLPVCVQPQALHRGRMT